MDNLELRASILEDYKPALEKLRAEIRQMGKAVQDASGTIQHRRELQNRIRQQGEQWRLLRNSAVGALSGITSGLTNVARRVASTAMSITGLTGAIGTLGGAAGFGMLIRQGITLNREMEKYRMTLATVYRSQAQANSQIDWIVRFAEKTPFQVSGLVETATALEAVGLNARKYLPIIGDLAAAFGGTEERVQMLVRAFSFMKSGVTGEAMETLRRFGISRKDFMDRGVQFDKSGQMLSGADAGMGALEDIIKTRYGGLMQVQSRTFAGVMSNLRDMAENFLRDTTEGVFGAIRDGANELLATLDDLRNNGTLRQWADEIGGYLKDAFDFTKAIGAKAFNAGKEGGLKGAFQSIIDDLKEPVGKGIDWIIDKLKTGLWATFDYLLKHPLLAALAGIMAAGQFGGAITAGVAVAPSVASMGKAAAGWSPSYALRAATGLPSMTLGAAAGAMMGVAAIPAAAVGTGLAVSHFATEQYRSDAFVNTGRRGSDIFSEMNDPEQLSVNMGGPTHVVQQIQERIQDAIRSVDAFAESVGQAASTAQALRDGLSNFIKSAPGLRAGVADDIASQREMFLDSLDPSAAGKLDRIRAKSASRWAELAGSGGINDMVGRLTAGSVNGANPGAIAANEGAGREATQLMDRQKTLAQEIVGLRREELGLLAKMSAEQVKQNQTIVQRLGFQKPKDRAGAIMAMEHALSLADMDPETRAKHLAALTSGQLQAVSQTGLLQQDEVIGAARKALVRQAGGMGAWRAHDHLVNMPLEVDRQPFIDAFDETTQDVSESFDRNLNKLVAAMREFDVKLGARFTDQTTSMTQLFRDAKKIQVEFPDPMEVKAKFDLLNQEEFRRWIMQAVRQGLPGGRADGTENHEANGVVGGRP